MRKGMWVIHKGHVGIVFEKNNQAALVHYVNDDGTTAEEVTVPIAELRQALFSEIPDCRRPVPELGKLLGYS